MSRSEIFMTHSGTLEPAFRGPFAGLRLGQPQSVLTPRCSRAAKSVLVHLRPETACTTCMDAVESQDWLENEWVGLKIRRASALGGSTPPPGTRVFLNHALVFGSPSLRFMKRQALQEKRDTAHAVSLPTSNLIYLFSLSDPAPNSLRCTTGRAALAAATAGIAAAAP
jgi:hypothetical protein